jgi:hypothetical protein
MMRTADRKLKRLNGRALQTKHLEGGHPHVGREHLDPFTEALRNSRPALDHGVLETDFSTAQGSARATPGLQTKLRVNRPRDNYEIEADAVSERVMRMAPDHDNVMSGSDAGSTLLQRKSDIHAEGQLAPPIVEEVLRSTGRPLDPETRAFMEPRFGHDFSQVRVHSGPSAAESARILNARAYTVGNNLAFADGQYAPSSQAGRTLIAHELAHVVQQESVPPVLSPESSETHQAQYGDERVADRIAGSNQANTDGPLTERPSGFVQRAPSGPEGLGAAAKKWVSDKYASGKSAAYKGLISALRTAQKKSFDALRGQTYRLPASAQPALTTILNIWEEIVGVFITLVLAVVGIVVGFSEGAVGMIEGLLSLIYGIVKWVVFLVMGFFDNGDKFNEFNKEIIAGLQNIPNGLRAFIKDWLEKFDKASIDEGSLMIAELTGQVLTIIASFGIAAAKVGQVPKLAGFTIVASGGGELAVAGAAAVPAQAAAAGVAAVAITGPTLSAAAGNKPAPTGGGTKPRARRPRWQQSERYVEDYLGKDWERQKSYRDTEPAKRSDYGNVSPDVYNSKLNIAVEVKNYDLLNEYDSLVSVLVEQGGGRMAYMPNGVKQWLFLDIRGQEIGDLAQMAARIRRDTQEVRGSSNASTSLPKQA